MNDRELVTTLKSCLDGILRCYPVKLAYLFGSAAEGTATPLSDVDIALVLAVEMVDPESQLSLELQIAEEISRICEISEADVRIINTAPLMIRGEVITNGQLLYSNDEVFRIEFETYTRSAYFDFMPAAAMIRQEYFQRITERGLNG